MQRKRIAEPWYVYITCRYPIFLEPLSESYHCSSILPCVIASSGVVPSCIFARSLARHYQTSVLTGKKGFQGSSCTGSISTCHLYRPHDLKVLEPVGMAWRKAQLNYNILEIGSCSQSLRGMSCGTTRYANLCSDY